MDVNAIIFCAVNNFSSSIILPHSNIPFATIVNKTRSKRIAFHIDHEYTRNIKEYLYNGA